MSKNAVVKFEEFLDRFSENEWSAAVESLLPAIHEVDRAAVQIWFRFYPLALFRYLENSEDRAKDINRFLMQGEYELKNQIDSSHKFLYGHRFWKAVKDEIVARAESFDAIDAKLTDEIKRITETVRRQIKVDSSLVTAITAVGLMTLVQTGFEAFKNAAGQIEMPRGLLKKSPDPLVKERAADDSQGIFGFLKTVDKKFTVVWDEADPQARFKIISNQEIASAAALDQSRDWTALDARCIEGVIPVECRSASCGTCWVGILGGQEKLSDVAELERKRMKLFGYHQPDEAKPAVRLACQAKASGNISLVIPPWNGVFGKKVYRNIEDLELQPATTSAKKLRETIAKAVSNDGEE